MTTSTHILPRPSGSPSTTRAGQQYSREIPLSSGEFVYVVINK